KQLLIDSGALKFGEFRLASGKTSDYYIDCKSLLLRSRPCVKVAVAMWELVYANRLGGIDAGGGPGRGGGVLLGTMMSNFSYSWEAWLSFIIRKQAKDHGLGRLIEAPEEFFDGKIRRCLLVEDVVTTGGSVLRAVNALRDLGHEVKGCVCIVD